MTREISLLELASLRGEGQFSKLYLALHQPTVLFRAQLAALPESNDGVAEITYENVIEGDYLNILPHQSLLVGVGVSALDSHSKGIIRIRKAPTETILYIGETSEINWEVGDYLTVVDEFSPFQRHLRITGDENTVYMDYDIEYTDQHENFNPVPVMLSHAVGWLNAEGYCDIPFDATGSWTPSGSALSVEWSLTGGGTFVGGPLNAFIYNPTVRYTAAGTYRVALTVTDGDAGTSSTGYRYVFIYDEAHPPFEAFTLNALNASYDAGGWQFEVVAHDTINQAALRDEALVILFSRDWFQGEEGSLGPVPGRENILALGWVDGETITLNSETSEVTFSVKGPHHWSNHMPGYPVGVEDTQLPQDGVSPSWTAINDLTLNKGLFHYWYWRSTVWVCTDVNEVKDARQMGSVEAPISSLWQQLTTMAYESILAKPLADRYGRIFVEVDPQFLDQEARETLPLVQEINGADWYENLMLMRRPTDECGYLECSGIVYDNGEATPVCTRAYGTALAHYGRVERRERLAYADVGEAIHLTGLIMGQINNEFPEITVRLASNHRFFDLAPRQYARLQFYPHENHREIDFNKKAIPRRFSYLFEEGAILADVVFEAETFETNAVLTTCPELPDLPPLPPPAEPPWPDIPPLGAWQYLVVAYDYNNSVQNNDHNSGNRAGIYVSDDFFSATSPKWYKITDGIPSNDLPFVKKLVSVVKSASEVVLYCLVTYTRAGGIAESKVFKMDNLLTKTRWHIVHYQTSPIEKPQGLFSIAAGPYHPDRLYGVGMSITQEDLGTCLSQGFFPGRLATAGVNINAGIGGLSLAPAFLNSKKCLDEPPNRYHHIDVIGTGIPSATQLMHNVLCNPKNGKVLGLYNASQDIFSWNLEEDPDVVGHYLKVYKPLPGMVGNVFKHVSSTRYNTVGTHTDTYFSGAYVEGVALATIGRNPLRLALSLDDGETWTFGALYPPASNYSARVFTQSVDLASDATTAFGLWGKSPDGGSSWTDEIGEITSLMYPQCVRHVPGESSYYVMGGKPVNSFGKNALFYTPDMGTTWINRMGTGMPLTNSDIRYVDVIAVPV